jgi:hypothetical protein
MWPAISWLAVFGGKVSAARMDFVQYAEKRVTTELDIGFLPCFPPCGIDQVGV